MGDEGIIVIAWAHHDPEKWTSLVRSNQSAKILEVRLGEARPEAASLESLSRLAEENGLTLRMRK
jgi:adenine-specific DNA methylase